jgi:hypothetical protein
MIELFLSGVFATHLWINGVNTFVKICEYRAPYEISRWYYYYPVKTWIYPSQECQKSKIVERL